MTTGGVAPSGAGGVEIVRYPGVDVVTVTGDLDVHHSPAVQSMVADATQVAQTEVVLDLSGVSFVDPAGVSALVFCRRVLSGRAAHLSLVCPEDGRIRRLLQEADIDGGLPIYHSTQDALQALVVGS